MKPRRHAKISAAKFGGTPDEYQKFHDWMDQSKMVLGDVRHRALLHHTLGIYLMEQTFGKVFVNSEGREVDVRDIGEQHVMDDLGWIPSPLHYFKTLGVQQWFGGRGTIKKRSLKSSNGPKMGVVLHDKES